MKYCMKCGRQLPDDAAFFCACGCAAAEGSGQTAPPETDIAQLVRTLSQRVQTNGIIWLVIGIVQLTAGFYYYDEGYLFFLIVGVLNILSAARDLHYSQTVRRDPQGIVNKFQPLLAPILTLLYNLFIGGIIGVVGSLYYFIALRSYVMENESAFRELDPPTPTDGPYY